jgi:hypothetical protein
MKMNEIEKVVRKEVIVTIEDIRKWSNKLFECFDYEYFYSYVDEQISYENILPRLLDGVEVSNVDFDFEEEYQMDSEEHEYRKKLKVKRYIEETDFELNLIKNTPEQLSFLQKEVGNYEEEKNVLQDLVDKWENEMPGEAWIMQQKESWLIEQKEQWLKKQKKKYSNANEGEWSGDLEKKWLDEHKEIYLKKNSMKMRNYLINSFQEEFFKHFGDPYEEIGSRIIRRMLKQLNNKIESILERRPDLDIRKKAKNNLPFLPKIYWYSEKPKLKFLISEFTHLGRIKEDNVDLFIRTHFSIVGDESDDLFVSHPKIEWHGHRSELVSFIFLCSEKQDAQKRPDIYIEVKLNTYNFITRHFNVITKDKITVSLEEKKLRNYDSSHPSRIKADLFLKNILKDYYKQNPIYNLDS